MPPVVHAKFLPRMNNYSSSPSQHLCVWKQKAAQWPRGPITDRSGLLWQPHTPATSPPEQARFILCPKATSRRRCEGWKADSAHVCLLWFARFHRTQTKSSHKMCCWREDVNKKNLFAPHSFSKVRLSICIICRPDLIPILFFFSPIFSVPI